MAAQLDIMDRSLHLAFDFYDTFLASGNQPNSRHQFYFFGLASLFIASKYEEIYPPSLREFILEASNVLEEDPSNQELFALSEEHRIALFSALLLKTEEKLLQSLNFETSRVLAFDFLSLFACDVGVHFPPRVVHFAHFLLVVSSLNPRLVGIPRVLLGFSALYLSNRLFGDSERWPKVKVPRQTRAGANRTNFFFTLNLFSKLNTMRYHVRQYRRQQRRGSFLASR